MSEQLIRQNREFVDQILTPYVDLSKRALEESVEASDSPGYELACLLTHRHFQESLQEGTQIIFSELPQLAHFHEFEGDWHNFVDRIQVIFTSMNQEEWIEDGGQFWEAMQYALEISPRLMQEFYAFGSLCYAQFERERAIAVMGLVSLLNPLLFEPWLVQGILHTQVKSTEMGLFCLTMAAIVRFDHPAPHLLMARCYYDLGDHELALRCAQIGADYVEECNDPQWRRFLQQLHQELRRH